MIGERWQSCCEPSCQVTINRTSSQRLRHYEGSGDAKYSSIAKRELLPWQIVPVQLRSCVKNGDGDGGLFGDGKTQNPKL